MDLTQGAVTLDFAQAPAGGPAVTETFEREHTEDLAGIATYTPAEEGLFSASLESEVMDPQLQTGAPAWRLVQDGCFGVSALVGDGANLLFKNTGGGALNLTVMRHHLSTGTYERYYTASMAGGATYTPADGGLFSMACDGATQVVTEYQYNAAWWKYHIKNTVGGNEATRLAIGDGTHLRYRNTSGTPKWVVLMRAIMVT